MRQLFFLLALLLVSNFAYSQKSIVILHDNDVHCAINGYSKMAALRNAIEAADTAYVIVVSSGDFINGGLVGTLSEGAHIVQIMNAVGYDASALGNHAFDFGDSRLNQLVKSFHGACVSTNFTYANSDSTVYQPYFIKTLGDKRVAFLGCTTPSVMSGAKGVMFDKNDNPVYTMHGQDMAAIVQRQVDVLREDGVDYIILLSHLGEEAEEAGCEWISTRLIQDTYGIDAVFDAHTHHVYADSLVADKQGRQVHLTQTGTEFQFIGKMWIGADGKSMNTSLIPVDAIIDKDMQVQCVIDSIKQEVDDFCNFTLGHADFELVVDGEGEKELIRRKETNFGDLMADAFAYAVGAPIGIVQSGSVKHSIEAGDITRGDLINTFIFANKVKKLRITGQQLKELLARATSKLPKGHTLFPQISGIKLEIGLDNQAAVIKNIQVIDPISNQYVPLDEKALYTIGINNYYTVSYNNILGAATELEYGDELEDAECVAKFIQEKLKGVIPDKYSSPQGRIIIRNKP